MISIEHADHNFKKTTDGKQGVPELGEIWIRLHYGANPKLAETAQSEDELRQAVAFPAARGPVCGS